MVERYDIFGPAQCEEIKDDGEWVKCEDFEKLEKLFLQMADLVSKHNVRPKEELLKRYKKIVGDK